MEKQENNYEEIFKKIESTPTLKKIKLAQDFVDEKLSYGFIVKNKIYIVNSDKKIIPFSELSKNGLTPVNENLYSSKFPIKSLEKFIDGEIKINPNELFMHISSHIKTFIYFQNERDYSLVALWIMGTYVFNIFRYFPYLHITADKGSGKSTLLDVMLNLCFNGSISTDSSAAVIYRDIDALQSTMLLDESENYDKKNDDASAAKAGILKGGFSKNGVVRRCVGSEYSPKNFSSYSPKILAGINKLEEVLSDRVVRIILSRNNLCDIRRFVESNDVILLQNTIREKLYFFGLEFASKIFQLYSSTDFLGSDKDLLDNRLIDIWLPQLIIAHIVDESNNDKSKSIFNEMKILMSKESDHRKEVNQEENEVIKILTAIYKLIENKNKNKIVRIKVGFAHITNTDLLEYLKNSKVVLENFTVSRLTTKLKELFNIDGPQPATVSLSSVREYRIEIEKVNQVYKSRITN
ncbi:MAG: hypothetical protein PF445_09815 [Melioribacteraceae bacterium]|jgi:hypothetical protein|nr:hypothetical protein [Melioribacteraceae bacterium]